MTNEAKALVERLRDTAIQGARLALKNGRYASGHEAADLIETQAREIERLNAMLTSAMYEAKAMMDEIKRLGGGMRISLEDLP